MDKRILFPSNSLDDRVVDPEFSSELETARWAGIGSALVNHDTLTSSTPEAVFRRLPETGNKLVYRGWMMTTDQYELMFNALNNRGISMLTNPAQYANAHYLPGWYETFKDLTAKTVVVSPSASEEEILEAAESLRSKSFIVKDYVKSRKHEWDTACFAGTIERLPSVVSEFIRLQDEFLVGGVVIREFLNLKKDEPEIRIWWVNGEPVLVTPHPDNAEGIIRTIDFGFLHDVADKVTDLGSPFVTTDVAITEAGVWYVIEVGDGQVSGLPKNISDDDLTHLFNILTN